MIRFLVGLALCAIAGGAAAEPYPQTRDEFMQLQPEQRKALPPALKLRFALPAPMPTAADALPAGPMLPNLSVSAVPGGQVQLGSLPTSGNSHDSLAAAGFDGEPMSARSPEFVDGTDAQGRAKVPFATPPAPIAYTFGFPSRVVAKMLMGFNGIYYVCSAGMADRYFLLTAGHCVYNWDPNDDENTADRQWADEIMVFPAQTDQLAGDFVPEHPYGEANVYEMHAYTGWTQNRDITYDQAFVRVDRPLGDRIGWFGYETNVSAAALNFSGYPAETPYVPSGEVRQYPGFDANNVTGYSEQRINMSAYTYGGHSGGPVWRFDGTTRFMQGMNSTSNRTGSATAARITNQVFNDLQAEINEPRSETLYPDIGEWTRWVDYPTKSLHTPFLLPQQQVFFSYNVGNLGFAASGDISVHFYLVYHQWMEPSDGIYLGSTQLPPLSANSWYLPDTSFALPPAVGGGTYYVAWIAYTNVAEYWSDSSPSSSCAPYCNNRAWIDSTPLRVAYPNERANLRMGSIDASSKFLLQGETIVISGNAINLGNFPASFFWIGAYLSQDAQCEPASDLLLGYAGVNSLSAGGDSGMVDLTVTIPSDATVGVSRLCLFADDTFSITESIEIDNAITLPVYVEFNDTIFADTLGG